MPAPFAALEARINTAVFASLANTVADFGGGVTAAGLFDAEYADAFGINGTRPSVVVSAAVPVVESAAVVIDSRSYTVTDVRAEGAGMRRLILIEAD